MTGTHPELGPELRALAAGILDKLDPALRQAARSPAAGEPAGKCSQVFCPVCALAALIEGEHHPLLAIIAEQSLALVMVVRAMIDPGGGSGDPGDGNPDGDRPDGYHSPFPPTPSTGYQHIPVDIGD